MNILCRSNAHPFCTQRVQQRNLSFCCDDCTHAATYTLKPLDVTLFVWHSELLYYHFIPKSELSWPSLFMEWCVVQYTSNYISVVFSFSWILVKSSFFFKCSICKNWPPVEFIFQTNRGQDIASVTANCCNTFLECITYIDVMMSDI